MIPPSRAGTKRILFVVNHAGFFLSHRLPLAIAARGAGYDVHVATPDSLDAPSIGYAGFAWHEIPLSRSGIHPFHELRAVLALIRLYRSLRPDIVHHVTSKPVLYGTAAARLAGVPAVANAVSGMGHAFTAAEPGTRMLGRIVGAGYAMFLRHPHMRVIFQNEEHRSLFIRRRWVRRDQTVLIQGSGVDLERFKVRRDQVGARAVPVVVLAARMLRTKGVTEFVEAARSLRDRGCVARFALVGDSDPDNPASIPDEQLRAWEQTGAVEWWGPRADMHMVFAEADVACLPSYAEGLPKVLQEAAAAGLPIVTSDVPGCRDVVTRGKNGLLVPVRDAEALATALHMLLSDPAMRSRMGAASRARAERDFAIERIVSDHLEVYDQLMLS